MVQFFTVRDVRFEHCTLLKQLKKSSMAHSGIPDSALEPKNSYSRVNSKPEIWFLKL